MAVQAALALSFAPWMLAQRGFLGGKASGRFDELTLPALISITRRNLVAFSVGTTVEPPLAHYLTLVFLLLAALGLVTAFRVRTDEGRWQPWLLLTWLAVPLACAWLVNPIMPFFQERYLLVVAPAFIILVARGLVRMTLCWQALIDMERRYTVFVHLLDGDNRIVAQMDGEPLGSAHPTTEWQLGEIVHDSYGLLIPPDTPPGEYLLEAGIYYLPTLDRLPVLDASGSVEDDRVVLGLVDIPVLPDRCS